MREVLLERNLIPVHYVVKGGPAGARVELCVGEEERLATHHTLVHSALPVPVVGVGVWSAGGS